MPTGQSRAIRAAGQQAITQTATSSASTDSVAASSAVALDSSLTRHLYRSLAKIERHLSRRDPHGLRRISAWYTSGAAAAASASEAGHVTGGGGQSSGGQRPTASGKRRRRRHRRLALGQKRMEQNEIDNSMLEYLKIPKGVAARSRLVPPQPEWLFSDSLPLPLLLASNSSDEAADEEASPSFRWLPLNSNVNNAESSSRRSMEREVMRQRLDQWIFLYFRVQRRNWESTVVEEKKASPDVNMYAEEHVHKWTVKLRFKIMRQVPVKVALSAFMSRLGLENNAHVIFCRDGFYGLMDVGNIHGEVTKTPCTMIGFNSTPRYLGLKNGDSIYVNACSVSQRQMMEEAPRQDAPKKRPKSSRLSVGSVDSSEESEEEGDFEIDVDSEEDLEEGLGFADL